MGAWSREGRRGRTGHDSPLVLTAGTPGFGFGVGEVWGVHLAWSGDSTVWAERNPVGVGQLGAASCWRQVRSGSRRATPTRPPGVRGIQ